MCIAFEKNSVLLKLLRLIYVNAKASIDRVFKRGASFLY